MAVSLMMLVREGTSGQASGRRQRCYAILDEALMGRTVPHHVAGFGADDAQSAARYLGLVGRLMGWSPRCARTGIIPTSS